MPNAWVSGTYSRGFGGAGRAPSRRPVVSAEYGWESSHSLASPEQLEQKAGGEAHPWEWPCAARGTVTSASRASDHIYGALYHYESFSLIYSFHCDPGVEQGVLATSQAHTASTGAGI